MSSSAQEAMDSAAAGLQAALTAGLSELGVWRACTTEEVLAHLATIKAAMDEGSALEGAALAAVVRCASAETDGRARAHAQELLSRQRAAGAAEADMDVPGLVAELNEQFRRSGSAHRPTLTLLLSCVAQEGQSVTGGHLDTLLAVLEVASNPLVMDVVLAAVLHHPQAVLQHHCATLLRMLQANDDTSCLAARGLLALHHSRPDLIAVAHLPSIYVAVAAASHSSLRCVIGPLLVALAGSYAWLARTAASLLTELLGGAEEDRKHFLVGLLVLIASKEPAAVASHLPAISAAAGPAVNLLPQLAAAVVGQPLDQQLVATFHLLETDARADLQAATATLAAFSASGTRSSVSEARGMVPAPVEWRAAMADLADFLSTRDGMGAKEAAAEVVAKAAGVFHAAMAAVRLWEEDAVQEARAQLEVHKVPVPAAMSLVGIVRVTLELQFACCDGAAATCQYPPASPFRTFTTAWSAWLAVAVLAAHGSSDLGATVVRAMEVREKMGGSEPLGLLLAAPISDTAAVKALSKQLYESTFYNDFAQAGAQWSCRACALGVATGRPASLPVLGSGLSAAPPRGTSSLRAQSQRRSGSEKQAAKEESPLRLTFWDACAKGELGIVQDMLAKGFDVNKVDVANRTGLHHAVMAGRAEAISMLMAAHADVTVLDSEGKVPFMVPGATPASRDLVLRLLRHKQAEVADSASHHCLLCQAKFSFTNRRHHCRHCGLLTCGNCTTKKVELPSFGHPNPTRVCQLCYPQILAARKQLWQA